jgi:hypothetical protein
MLIYSLSVAVFFDVGQISCKSLNCCISASHQPIALLFWVTSRSLGSVDGLSHAPSHERGNPTALDLVAVLYQDGPVQ